MVAGALRHGHAPTLPEPAERGRRLCQKRKTAANNCIYDFFSLFLQTAFIHYNTSSNHSTSLMKIVHISMADFNGAGLCAYRICKAQREMGIDSQMVVLNKRHHDDFIHQCGKKRYFYHSVLRKTKKLLRLKDDVNTCRRLGAGYHAVYTLPVSSIDLSYERLLREADLLHIHWVGGYLDYPTFFEAFKDKPIVFTLHDENALYGIANIEQQLLADNPLEKKYYRMKYDSLHKVKRLGVVFLSRMSYDLYGHHEMVADRPTTIIHNSVDTRFYEPHDRSEARRRLGLAPETPVFALCACNINEPRKGLEVLSQTLRRISPDCRVLAIGNNRSRPRRHWDNGLRNCRGDCLLPTTFACRARRRTLPRHPSRLWLADCLWWPFLAAGRRNSSRPPTASDVPTSPPRLWKTDCAGRWRRATTLQPSAAMPRRDSRPK